MAELSSIVAEDHRFENVQLFILTEHQFDSKKFVSVNGERPVRIVVIDQSEDLLLRFVDIESRPIDVTTGDSPNKMPYDASANSNQTRNYNNVPHPSLQNLYIGGEKIIHEITLYRESDCFPFINNSFVINCESRQSSVVMIQFNDKNDLDRFVRLNNEFKKHHKQSMFNQRTDIVSASQYFQFYGYLSQQQNMMQDYVRTSTYQRAIHSNSEDFKDKVILDVGAGSGILSFFALQAGARKVYAVEASSMAKHAQSLVQANNLGGRIEVIAGKIEEIELPEPVDMIISEPMGYMLFNERMLETYLHAKKWLRSPETGMMFPSRGDLHIAPFTDAQLYIEQTNKANFWFSQDFHGVDLRALHSAATNEYFRQPVVDTFDIRICMAKTVRHVVDFQKASETDLHCISIPLKFIANQSGHIHGLAFWFDVAFIGSAQTIWLSTAPSQPLTHWYQVRCLLQSPLFVNKGQLIEGNCVLKANKRQSYDVDIELMIEELGTRSSNSLDLKNPYFRYTGQPVQPPPGLNDISPSEQLWSTMAVIDPYQQQQQQQIQLQQQQQLLPQPQMQQQQQQPIVNNSHIGMMTTQPTPIGGIFNQTISTPQQIPTQQALVEQPGIVSQTMTNSGHLMNNQPNFN